MKGTDLVVELEATIPPAMKGRPIVARLMPGQPGVRFEVAERADIIMLGFPMISDLLFFRPMDDVSAGHNCVTGPLAEVIRSRGVSRVFFSDPELWVCVRKAVRDATCSIHFGGEVIAREEFRPRFSTDRTKPGDHWVALAELTE